MTTKPVDTLISKCAPGHLVRRFERNIRTGNYLLFLFITERVSTEPGVWLGKYRRVTRFSSLFSPLLRIFLSPSRNAFFILVMRILVNDLSRGS